MPAKSQAQRAYLNARFGHEWVREHHFDNTGKLPEHKKKKHRYKTDKHHQIAMDALRKI
jgi:N-acetylglutamate synthase-like GNAT family acetyltransferase